jgi:NAD(P)H-dependent flavin oxidoreductase YrpB (nitropropane dioxygenase family)
VLAGAKRRTACCITRRSKHGKRRDGLRPVPAPGEGEVIARSRSVGEIVRYQSSTPDADFEGDIDALSLWAGQSVCLVSEIKPAGGIVREIVAQAQSTLAKLAQ